MGITLNTKLGANSNVLSRANKACKLLFSLKRLSRTTLSYFQAFFYTLPHLEYAIWVPHPANQMHLKMCENPVKGLQHVQYEAALLFALNVR